MLLGGDRIHPSSRDQKVSRGKSCVGLGEICLHVNVAWKWSYLYVWTVGTRCRKLSTNQNVFVGSRDLSPYVVVTLPPMKKVKVNASYIPLEDEFSMQDLLYIVVYFHKCDA